METSQDGQPHPYERFVAWLDGHWSAMVASAGDPDVLPLERQKELAAFVQSLLGLLEADPTLRKYPADPIPYSESSGSWSEAENWAREMSTSQRVTTGISVDSNVRDAFNAGWLCWSWKDDADPEQIGDKVQTLCKDIMQRSQAELQPAETIVPTVRVPSASRVPN